LPADSGRATPETGGAAETTASKPAPHDADDARPLTLSLLGAHQQPAAARVYGDIYRKLESKFQSVAEYHRLRVFAGRTLTEISALVEERPDKLKRVLDDFEGEMERAEAPVLHEH
jgi:hypothetical protein